MKKNRLLNRFSRTFLALNAALLITVFGKWNLAQATATDVSPAPIFTTTTATTEVKPNIMFVLDDSGSMDWDYMPDKANDFSGNYGFPSSQCNGVYYNPAITYTPPVDAAGTSYANSSFTGAWVDGYKISDGTKNLSTSFRSNSSDASQAAYYYVYSGTQTTEKLKDYYNSNGVFYKECNSVIGSTTKVDGVSSVNTLFTKKIVSATSGLGSADERTNFANWYSYYRTRMLMMKTSTGQAFQSLDGSHFRIGFMTINNNVSPSFLNISDFTSTQKSDWYSKLYASNPNNSTPLREALANVGRLYAGKITTLNGAAVTNPVQYSCQQNYTILSTDGFWNGTDSNVKKLDGSTTMDNQDGAFPRPYYDGSTVNYIKSTSQILTNKTQLKENTNQLQKRMTQIQSRTTQNQSKTTQIQSQTTQIQKKTVQNQSSTTQLQKSTQQFTKCKSDGTSCQNVNFNCSSGTSDTNRPLCSPGTRSAWSDVSTCTAGNGSGNGPVTYCRTTSPVLANVGTCTPSSNNGRTVTCNVASDTGWVNAASCSASNPSSGPTISCQTTDTGWVNASSCTASGLTNGRTISCQTTNPAWVNVASCSASGPTNGQTTLCQTTDTGWVNATSCAASGPTNGKTIACQTTDTGWVGTNSCSAGSSGGLVTTCQTVPTGPTPVASCGCTASAGASCTITAAAGNNWTQTTCNNSIIAAAAGAASCTADSPTAANGYVSTNCSTVTTGPTSTSSCTPASASAANNFIVTTCDAGTPTGGTSNTLADVAAYYYNTNLRTSVLGNCTGPIISPATTPTNLCLPNKVPSNGLDVASWQHMTTFTLGLGARGRMVFSSTYLTDGTGTTTPTDYSYVAKQTNKDATTCTWADALSVASKPCNWPLPGSDNIENIDDLWHAAVNGHGNYFSATDPGTLKNALSSSLNVIINTPEPGTAASAATTNPKITANNNFQFSSYFKSVEWSGELIRQRISLLDGSVPAYNHMTPDPTSYDWSAQTLLDGRTYSERTIYTKGSTGLIPFTWNDLGTAGLQSKFTAPHISTSPPLYPTQLTGLSQFCTVGTDCINATAQSNNTVATNGAAGEALVNFLRGDRSNEEGPTTDPTKYFRHRAHVLGDIVSAQPQYVGPPNRSYIEGANPGYDAFKSSNAARAGIVYTAANDGMLHAFDAETGAEKWAYIPSFVLHRLYTLADKNYSDKHQYFVEGTPKSGDVYIGGAWKTILVGGLNGGGTGYYALDITNPNNPNLLWEFSDANMGYSFGNPEITKLDDGTWVVLLASGYNNCPHTAAQPNCVMNATGNGNGHLYVINAATGALVSTSSDISTGVGNADTPTGLSKIMAHAPTDNVTTRVYGGDLLGNLWRFTIGSAGYSKQLLATFKDALGNPQPITDRPQVTTYNTKPIIYVGTGRYLGTTDVGSTLQQSFYAIKDNLDTTSYGNLRTDTSFISNVAVNGTCPDGTDVNICQPGTKIRTATQTSGTSSDSLNNKNGWFIDFPANSGELAFTDPKLVHGTLSFSTSTPSATTSEVCGSTTSTDPVALGYMLDYLTGGSVGGGTVGTGGSVNAVNIIASILGTGVATAPQIAQLPNGTVIAKYRLSSGQEVTQVVRFGSGGNSTKRVSWRELITE